MSGAWCSIKYAKCTCACTGAEEALAESDAAPVQPSKRIKKPVEYKSPLGSKLDVSSSVVDENGVADHCGELVVVDNAIDVALMPESMTHSDDDPGTSCEQGTEPEDIITGSMKPLSSVGERVVDQSASEPPLSFASNTSQLSMASAQQAFPIDNSDIPATAVNPAACADPESEARARRLAAAAPAPIVERLSRSRGRAERAADKSHIAQVEHQGHALSGKHAEANATDVTAPDKVQKGGGRSRSKQGKASEPNLREELSPEEVEQPMEAEPRKKAEGGRKRGGSSRKPKGTCGHIDAVEDSVAPESVEMEPEVPESKVPMEKENDDMSAGKESMRAGWASAMMAAEPALVEKRGRVNKGRATKPRFALLSSDEEPTPQPKRGKRVASVAVGAGHHGRTMSENDDSNAVSSPEGGMAVGRGRRAKGALHPQVQPEGKKRPLFKPSKRPNFLITLADIPF